jgi:hypothetical protein
MVSAACTMSLSDWPIPTDSTITLVADRAQQGNGGNGMVRQAPEPIPRCHGANEDMPVFRVRMQPRPVAQKRATGKMGGRIDRQNGDTLLLVAERP